MPEMIDAELAYQLKYALEYMVDVFCCDGHSVWTEPDQAPYFQTVAFVRAMKALRGVTFVLRRPDVDRKTAKAREATLDLERGTPVKLALGDDLVAATDRMTKAMEVFKGDRWERMDFERRLRNAGGLVKLTREILRLANHIAEPLPTTTVCICRSCGTVLLPTEGPGSFYVHCGRTWNHHRDLNNATLPDGFWETYRPGDLYRKFKQLEVAA